MGTQVYSWSSTQSRASDLQSDMFANGSFKQGSHNVKQTLLQEEQLMVPRLYISTSLHSSHNFRTLILQYMNVHRAIIVLMSGDPHHVPLPSTALADMKIFKYRFTRVIRDSSRINPGESRTDLIVLLQIIWDRIMLPIIDVLEHVLKPKRPSRIWLCPTAASTSIYLHAAHPFQTKADRSGKEPCLEGLYICSYTPTLSALIRSRQLIKKRVPPSFVAIGQGQLGAGKDKALLAVDSATMSLKLAHKLVPATANRATISGDKATRAGALEALQQNTWVHLACHGKQDPAQLYNPS